MTTTTRPSRPRRWLRGAWRLLEWSRRAVLNLIFLAVLAAVALALWRGGAPALQERTVLVLDLQGKLVEQRDGNIQDSLVGRLRGGSTPTTSLRDVLEVLEAAATDPNITGVLLQLDEFQGGGLASLREVAAALQRFKASGKPVVAWGSGFDQRQYLLAAQANEVLMHPMGEVGLKGLGGYRNYYRDALDKLGVQLHLVRVGTYKSAAEPFIANEPSSASTEAETALYGALWSTYTNDIEQARKLAAGSVQAGIDTLPERLAASGGDTARLALEDKLVDGLKTRDEVREIMVQRGTRDDQLHSFRQIAFEDYVARASQKRTGDAIGVVVAEGAITDGVSPPGAVGGLSTAALIRQAREDDAIKALVLRVNSPGGSPYGSELVRRELELTRAAGKPVVVSMGDVAASGGYWIAMAADEVIADSATITGSIGVFTLLPTVDQALDKLGVHTGGVTTTWLAGAADPRRPLDARYAALAQSRVDHIYADFIGRAAQARKSTPAQIDTVAQGRVWTGAQALERGLVDRVGHYTDALASAARRAQLAPDHRIVYLERSVGRLERLLDWFGGASLTAWVVTLERPWTSGLPPVLATVHTDLDWLAAQARSGQPYPPALIHCLCGSTGL